MQHTGSASIAAMMAITNRYTGLQCNIYITSYLKKNDPDIIDITLNEHHRFW